MYSVSLRMDQTERETDGEVLRMCGWRPSTSQRYKHDEGLRSEMAYLHSPEKCEAGGEKMKT